MTIEILSYTPVKTPHSYAYVDVQYGAFRFNGVNLHRDGRIGGGMLVYYERSERFIRTSIEFPAEVQAEIQAAVDRHLAAIQMPPEVARPPAWTPEEIAAKEKRRLDWMAKQKAAGAANKAAKKAAKAAPPKPALRPAAQPAPAPVIRARIEPGKPLILRPPLRRQG
jgi:hypothetical protein